MKHAIRVKSVFEDQALTDCQAFLVYSPENRRYLSGFSGSSAYLLVTRESRWLFTDFRYTEQAAQEAQDYQVIRHGPDALRFVVEQAKKAHLDRIGYEAHKMTVRELELLGQAGPDIQWIPTSTVVEKVRMTKSPDEIEAIREAARIAGSALERTLPFIRPGVRELDIALELEIHMRRLGAERLAFDTIVASGARGSLPHGHPTDKRIQDGDLVTIDFGAYLNGYNSDETVTLAVGADGVNRERLRQIYDIVFLAQKTGIEAIGPGVSAASVDLASRRVIEERGYGAEFGHSTGHGVGLEVHELPWVAPKPPLDYLLAPGMVVTVEPGIYLPGIGGVRLEDTLVVTETGSERLTTINKTWQQI